MDSDEARSHLCSLFTTAINAVDPRKLIQRVVYQAKDRLIVQEKDQAYTLPLTKRVFILGAGKGAGFLAQGLETVLDECIVGGIVVLPHGQNVDLHHITIVHGEHPLPGPGSKEGGARIADLLAQKQNEDLVCFCLTGGASSLLVSPAADLSLEDKLEMNRLLIACGAEIHEINIVRKHLSQVKGGGLARWVFPSPLISFILSDVIDDDLSTIGSGPTVPDPTTFHDAWNILERFALLDRIPSSVKHHLHQGVKGLRQETPKPEDIVFKNVSNFLIGSNRFALEAAATSASSLGFLPFVLETPLSGDTTDAATGFAEILRTILSNLQKPVCFLAGGETTVRVIGSGKGGRNQEFALVAAQILKDETRWMLLSAGTDGIDGPTDAAGAFVDGSTEIRAKEKGFDSCAILNNNDTYPFFAALGDLFCPGQTGTNVMDIKIALLWP
jgi:hydroxypyruvate reductase